jgi:hypothetical protein
MTELEIFLAALSLLRTGVTDLTPIQGMPLKQLRLDYRPEHEKSVRSFKELEFINDKPVGQFFASQPTVLRAAGSETGEIPLEIPTT